MALILDRITIDGRTLIGVDAMEQFELWVNEQGKEAWMRPLQHLLNELLGHGTKAISAHTSGTTGPPKPIAIPRTDLVNSARLTARTFDLRSGDRALLCLPCDYIAGKMMVVRAMVTGLDLHLVDPRGSILDGLHTHDRFRFTAMVPLQLHRILMEDRSRVEAQFDTILLGGGPVSDALIQDVAGLRTRVYHSYGSTETLTHVAIRALNGPDRSDHLKAIGDVRFEQDPRGCLFIHTPHLSVKEHLTNDLVDLLDERTFRWLGRSDNVILSGGKKIFPEQLEAKTAGVIPYAHYFTSFNDERLGQAVMLVLETELPSDDVLPDVIDRITGILERHELPRRITALRSFQRTPSGKVQRDLTLQGIAGRS